MANLKLDLLNKINNEKYFEEMELVRLAQEPNMHYKQKIEDMYIRLGNIALLNAEIGLVEQYFKEPTQQQPVMPQQGEPVSSPPKGQVHQGQSHGE